MAPVIALSSAKTNDCPLKGCTLSKMAYELHLLHDNSETSSTIVLGAEQACKLQHDSAGRSGTRLNSQSALEVWQIQAVFWSWTA